MIFIVTALQVLRLSCFAVKMVSNGCCIISACLTGVALPAVSKQIISFALCFRDSWGSVNRGVQHTVEKLGSCSVWGFVGVCWLVFC